MLLRWIKAILILPVNALVVLPLLIMWATSGTEWRASMAPMTSPGFWIAVVLTIKGLVLAVGSASMFAFHGKGTPAPWDPPQQFVVHGLYRYVRNPMIVGVLQLMAAEVLFFQSVPLMFLWLFFLAANLLYIPLFEEKSLAKRFGEPYLTYKKNVPRWLPRMTAWRGNSF